MQFDIRPQWITFDIPDLQVNPGTAYHLVLASKSNYHVGLDSTNPYPDGHMGYSTDAGAAWKALHDNPNYDMAFKIYGTGQLAVPPLTTVAAATLDQSQTSIPGNTSLEGDWWLSQGFIPSMLILTSVEVYVGTDFADLSNPLTLQIRGDSNGLPSGSVLASASVTITRKGWKWITFDIPDLQVNPGTAYHLVLASKSNYHVGLDSTNPYPDGHMGYSTDAGAAWKALHDNPNYDMAFKIYGTGQLAVPPLTTVAAATLDQSQTSIPGNTSLEGDWWLSQGFIPSMLILTSVEVYVGTDFADLSNPLTLQIRGDSNGLPSVTVLASTSVTIARKGWNWVTFDLPDLTVNSGTSYHLVLSSTSNYHAGLDSTNPYPHGYMGYSADAGATWKTLHDTTNYDMAFKIYGTTPEETPEPQKTGGGFFSCSPPPEGAVPPSQKGILAGLGGAGLVLGVGLWFVRRRGGRPE